MARPVEDDNVFFFDTFLPLCEQSFRFNCFVSSNVTRAFSCLLRTTEEFYSELKDMEDSEQRLPHFIKHCWQGLEKSPRPVKAIDKDKLAAAIVKCSPEERGYLAALDCLGLTDAETREVFALDSTEVLTEKITAVRQQLAKDGDFDAIKPKIQDLFRTATLSEAQRNKLRDLILPGFDAQTEQDKVKSDAESGLRKERLRNYLIVGIGLIILGVAARYFQQGQDVEAKVIEWLGYETLAIEEDPQRLDFPSSNTAEIRSYFANHRGLNFQHHLLRTPSAWQPRGASVIDYDSMLVAVVRYEDINSDDFVLHYSFRGKADNLSASPENTVDDFTYRSYASDELNMIAWSQDQSVAVLVGRLGTEDLVVLGKTSSSE